MTPIEQQTAATWRSSAGSLSYAFGRWAAWFASVATYALVMSIVAPSLSPRLAVGIPMAASLTLFLGAYVSGVRYARKNRR